MPMSERELTAFQIKLSVEIWRDIYKKLMVDFNNKNPLVLNLFPTGVTYESMRQLLENVMDNEPNVGAYGKVLEVFKKEYDSQVNRAKVSGVLTEQEAESISDSLTGGFANLTLGLMAERNKVRPTDAAELVQSLLDDLCKPRPETPDPYGEVDRGAEEEESGDDMEVEDEPPEPEDHRKKRRM